MHLKTRKTHFSLITVNCRMKGKDAQEVDSNPHCEGANNDIGLGNVSCKNVVYDPSMITTEDHTKQKFIL